MGRRFREGILLVASLCSPAFLQASIPLYRSGSGVSVELGIRVQLQYYHLGGEGWSERDLFVRRLRPSLEARFSASWEAEVEFDFGETIEGKAVEFKDIFLTYLGAESKGFRFTVGNEKAVFSRQFQSSSKSLTLIDRGFAGIDDFGSLDRVLGARVDGRDSTGRLAMAASIGLASHEPDAGRMEFESPLNAGEDANRGLSLSGRVELAPLGAVEYDQGDFANERLRFTLAGAAYRWSNDGTRNLYTEGRRSLQPGLADLDRVRGLEVSGAVRGRGLSADAELQSVRGETRDPGYTGGLYDRGEADLSKLSVQSGYMVFPRRVEVAAGFDRLDAESYEAAWKRLSLGGTYYWTSLLKLQINYLRHWAFFGRAGEDPQAVTTQLQIVF